MDTNTIQKPLTTFVHRLTNDLNIQQVIVFGSQVEGNAGKDSDIDCYVVSNDFEGMDTDQRLDLLYPARRLIEPEVHPWGVTKEELQQASKQTTLGYARDHGYRFL